ncbi:Acetyltransferase (GNAT) family protein [Microlunatus flavus]|uniref:Acetyltransferase (GNAT) family protein n=1 Tax=Microlunatus flavus TaxID=1036181 RepID=A0A1H9N2M6_9ACTN|nr:Acetyltransferase (GNAT) family protein [Microlunatus flavus]
MDVDPGDEAQLEALTRFVDRARVHDDPDAFALTLEDTRNDARYGGDLHPARHCLVLDDGVLVGHVWMHVPHLDNLHLVEAGITIDPDRRGRGLGSRVLAEVERRTRSLGRTTLWIGTADDAEATKGFLGRRGFALATRDARRHQRLALVDAGEVDRLEREAAEHARDYVVERLQPP